MSRTTLTKVEKGDPTVSVASYANVLFALGMIERLADLADPTKDLVGLQLDEDRLPQRIRLSRQASPRPGTKGPE
jgi:hypothetical protein